MKRDIIAIVDDDSLVRESVQRLVESLNLRSELFASIDELLAFHAFHEVGCIVSDVYLVNEDASRLQDRLTALGCRTPIIFMTADESPSLKRKLRAAGATSILGKPFSPREMVDLVVAALRQVNADSEKAHQGFQTQ